MRYRRRTFIPVVYLGRQLGHLLWNGSQMEAWTAKGELVGEYPTRREAASALWRVIRKQKNIPKWTTSLHEQS